MLKRRKSLIVLSEKQKKTTLSQTMLDTLDSPTALRPQFNEPHLFEMYFVHQGNIPRMLQTISFLSPEQRPQYPARPTLYEYEKKFQWKERHKKMRESVVKEMESSVALTFERLNQLASLAATGLAKRLVNALQTGNEKEMRIFNGELLKIMWEIMRCERGLPSHVTHSTYQYTAADEAGDVLRDAGLGHVADVIDSAPPEYLLGILNMFGGDQTQTPVIIQ